MSLFSKKETEPKSPEPKDSSSSRLIGEMKRKVASTDLPPYVADQVNSELERLEKTDSFAAEY